MTVADVLLAALFSGILAAPAAILVLGRRKQKRRHFPDIDMGRRRWDGPPVQHAAHEVTRQTDSLIDDGRRAR